MLKLARVRIQSLQFTLRSLAGRNQTLSRLHHRLTPRLREASVKAARLRAGLQGKDLREAGVQPENMIWIFGSGRSGSTWLAHMMNDLTRHQIWEEPLVGQLFGDFHNRAAQAELRRPDFIMGDSTRQGWLRAVRRFVLDCAGYSRPGLGAEDYLVVKEPNGSIGAPLLMEALPESRMVLLVRDPRDIVSSMLDGARQGGWMYMRRGDSEEWKRRTQADKDPDTFIRNRSRKYLQHASSAKKAFDRHKGPKVLIRYEELRADTVGTLRRMYSQLGIASDEGELTRVVHEHDWENVPEEQKGKGKFYRRATPGGWREDLTPEQAAIIEKVTAPLLKELYPSG
jgi:hypothetical protein